MKVTLQDIAKELDISSATVSLALRDDPLIHPDTRARVNEVALRLNYKGSSGRRSAQKTERIALGLLLSTDSLARARNDTNLVQMMDGLMAEADSRGYLLNIHAIRPEEAQNMANDPALIPSIIRDGVCQGVIIRGPHTAQDVAFIANQMPVVSMGRVYRESKVDTVLANNMEAVRSLTTLLQEKGHRRMGWVGGSSSSSFFEERQAGFIMGCVAGQLDLREQHFFGPEIFQTHNHEHRIIDAAALIAAAHDGTTAFVCGNDSIASQVIIALEQAELKVPQNISVTGFDGVPTWSTGNRQITSVDPHFIEMGRAAVRLLIHRLENPELQPQMVIVQSEIVAGETISAAE